MNQVMETLLARRSTRSFEEKALKREDLEQIVKAALYAPSGKGLQTWRFTVLTDTAKIQKLAAAIAAELGRDGYNMYCPQALIIPSNEKSSPFGKEDNACALENIFLAAHSLGIGSVWINQLQGICDAPAIRAILDEFEIPSDHIVYGMAALGYPAPAPQKEVVKTGRVHFID